MNNIPERASKFAVKILLFFLFWNWVKPCRNSNQPSAEQGVKAGHSGYDARGLQITRSTKRVGSDDDDCDDLIVTF